MSELSSSCRNLSPARRLAQAAHIRRDDGVVLSELVEKPNSTYESIAEPVSQYERLLPGSCL